MGRADKTFPEFYGKPLSDMKSEEGYYWTCSFCGYSKNEGTTDRCWKCDGVRKTA